MSAVKPISFILLGAAICATMAFPAPTLAAEPLANMGTLTCVASPGETEPLGPERQLSCTFEPLIGPKAQLKGIVKQVGAQTAGDAKIVLAWTVLAPKVDTPAKQLEGRYVGAIGEGRGANATGLTGGASGSITLRPLTLDPNIGENAALAVVELQLAAMRA
jgi:hypothetical protein